MTWRLTRMVCLTILLASWPASATAQDSPPAAEDPLPLPELDLVDPGPLWPTGTLREGWIVSAPIVVSMHPTRFRELVVLARKAGRLEAKWKAALDELAAARQRPLSTTTVRPSPWYTSPVTWGLAGVVAGAVGTALAAAYAF